MGVRNHDIEEVSFNPTLLKSEKGTTVCIDGVPLKDKDLERFAKELSEAEDREEALLRLLEEKKRTFPKVKLEGRVLTYPDFKGEEKRVELKEGIESLKELGRALREVAPFVREEVEKIAEEEIASILRHSHFYALASQLSQLKKAERGYITLNEKGELNFQKELTPDTLISAPLEELRVRRLRFNALQYLKLRREAPAFEREVFSLLLSELPHSVVQEKEREIAERVAKILGVEVIPLSNSKELVLYANTPYYSVDCEVSDPFDEDYGTWINDLVEAYKEGKKSLPEGKKLVITDGEYSLREEDLNFFEESSNLICEAVELKRRGDADGLYKLLSYYYGRGDAARMVEEELGVDPSEGGEFSP